MNSLGFAKVPEKTRVVVAMSGGVDSSVVAVLLKEQGYDVIGVTLQLYDMGETVATSKTCCAGQDIYDAKRVAEMYDFPHYVLNYQSRFKESVIDDFADGYLRGETPIPCVQCNQTVKFRDLLKTAKELQADCMATGHYIQRDLDEDNHAVLLRGKDAGKDQSYFLFATTQEQLDYLRFPLGGWDKNKTRAEAKRLGLVTADKPDSQDICFVPHGDYAKVVTKLRPEAETPGDIVNEQGDVLGQHKGIIHYTIGQRKGIGIGGGISNDNAPLYVVRIDAKYNKIVVGEKNALSRNVILINNCNWLFKDSERIDVTVKFRSVMNPVAATLLIGKNDTARIELNGDYYGISPGQAAVSYIDDRMIGGGWIYDTARNPLNPSEEKTVSTL